jgi:hypothetical protein
VCKTHDFTSVSRQASSLDNRPVRPMSRLALPLPFSHRAQTHDVLTQKEGSGKQLRFTDTRMDEQVRVPVRRLGAAQQPRCTCSSFVVEGLHARKHLRNMQSLLMLVNMQEWQVDLV